MREETREIIDEIICQWAENKLYILTSINNEGNEVFTVVRDTKQTYEKIDNKPIPEPQKVKFDSRHNPNDTICRIVATKNNEAYIYFRGCYSIDIDFNGVYEYLKEFFGVIRSKARQMNAQGIKFKLGLINTEKLGKVSSFFKENKQEVLERLYSKDKERIYKYMTQKDLLLH